MRGRMPGWVSRDDRQTVEIDAVLRIIGRDLPVTIVDISNNGCKIRCDDILPIGEVAHLEMTAFQPTPISIRWSLIGMAGLRFL